MIVRPDPVSFTGYQSVLKTYWRQGKLPSVKRGFYGDELTQDTVSLEHLLPKSQGGKTELDNLVLASKRANNKRGTRPLCEAMNREAVGVYLSQFVNIKLPHFDGNKYISLIVNTISKLF